MPSFTELLEQGSRRPTAIFHRFRISAESGDSLHVFYEGYEDIVYYSPTVERVAEERGLSWQDYVCFGKKNMDAILQLYEQSGLKGRRVVFVRDSDFDRFLGKLPQSDSVFITCGYAVENYVCTVDTVRAFIVRNFGIDPVEVNVDDKLEEFRIAVGRLFEWLSPFVGAALLAISEDRQLDLDRLEVAPVVRQLLAGDEPPVGYPAPQLDACGLTAADFTAASADRGQQFVEQDAFAWLRGKYLMMATAVFLEEVGLHLLREHRARRIVRFNRRANANYERNVLFERLCTHAREPAALAAALEVIAA